MNKYVYGIDFGTSNSVLSILDVSTNQIVKTFNEHSLIFFPKPENQKKPLEIFVGNKAIEKYLENAMKGRFMKSIKKVLPQSKFKETLVYNKKFNAEELVSIILGYLKKIADSYVQEDVKTVVLGRPVVFDEDPEKDQLAQERMFNAAKLAGFEHIAFQLEPIAAAFTYEKIIVKDELVLVADLGGGTSDFTLMKLSPLRANLTERKNDIIGQGGIYIGGDNFDSSIMWHRGTFHFGRGLTFKDYDTTVELPLSLFFNICSWEKMNFFDSNKLKNALKKYQTLTGKESKFNNLVQLIENNLGYTLFQQIEKTKIELSNSNYVKFDFDQSGIKFEEVISIEEFTNNIIGEDLYRIKKYLLDFIEQSDVDIKEIETVFMTGGTSMVKPVKNIITDIFGVDKIKSGDNFNSVANGLAFSHILFFN